MRMNYTFGGIVGVVLMFSGFIYYRYRTKSKLNSLLRTINNELAAQRDELAIKNEEISIRNEEILTQRDELAAQSDQLAAQRDQLERAYHKLKELDEFKEAMSGMIVHDLKNPLSAIIGISNKDQISKNDQTAIRQAGKQMLNLTLNILDVQKFEQAKVPLNRRDEALAEIVQDAFDQVSLLASNKNQQLLISFEATTGVHADFELISRVLMNLLTNAIKYTPNNGKITIGTEEMPDNQVKISVSDTGQGIPADKLDTVFDKFSQVEARKSGGARSTGLGLTFCKMVVEAHGGRIWVTSEVGVGTTFYFTLAKAVAEIEAVEAVNIPHYEQRQISLTEDDQTILAPFLENLRKLDVYEAGDVLKILAQIPDTPNLTAWKSEMESTLFASNQERYAELVQGA
jgi:signal transduction histidine kinase